MRRVTTFVTGALAAGAAALALRSRRAEGRVDEITRALDLPPEPEVLSEAHLEGLPDPVRRYLAHAIAPGTPLARTVHARQSARMRPKPGAAPLEVTADELLTPPLGMVWRASTRMMGLPVRIVDTFHLGRGRVEASVLGVVPVMRASGADVSRSTLHRVVAEAIWVPSALLPRCGTRWEVLAGDHLRCHVPTELEEVTVDIRIDGDGRVLEVTMLRHGDTGVPSFRGIPYGFAVEAEATFDGYTVPSRLRGGWWYGTDRYDPDQASAFTIEEARYR